MKEIIGWEDFEKIDFRCGTIISVEEFPEAKKPAYILHIDFGEKIGRKKSSAQLTEIYTKEELIGKQVLAIINFPKKQIGPIKSQCLVCGFYSDKGVVLAGPATAVENGCQLG